MIIKDSFEMGDTMSIEHCILPEHYRSLLTRKKPQMAIKLVKDTFERKLADNLRLIRVSAPLFVEAASGLNDTSTAWSARSTLTSRKRRRKRKSFIRWRNGNGWR